MSNTASPQQPAAIYLNHAASGLMSANTVRAITEHLALEASVGGYVAAEHVQGKLQQLGAKASRLLGCEANEIAFTDSGTRAWHRAVESVNLQPGDVVLVSPMIWGGNYYTLCQYARLRAVVVKTMPTTPEGDINIPALAQAITPRVKLLELCQAGSGWDIWQQVAAVGKLAAAHGLPLLVDACQALGQQPMHIDDLGCTMLVASGRKWLRGPRGTGILYVSNAWSQANPPTGLDQHAATLSNSGPTVASGARPFELGETSIALRLGLGVAIDEALENQGEPPAKLGAYLRQRLKDAKNIVLSPTCETATQPQRGAIVTFTHRNLTPPEVKRKLRELGVEVNVHPAAFMPLHQPTQNRGDCVRISPHVTNTMAELDRVCDLIESLT